MANDFLPFSTSGTANANTNAEYLAEADRLEGNQPGIAKSKLVNKALRQCSIISTVVAQFISDITTTNAVDDGTTATLLTNFKNATNVAFNTNIATAKTTPIDADELPIADSAASFGLKKLTWANLKATLFQSIPQRRNYLINGNFKSNELGYVSGTATITANQYIFNRWYIPTLGESATFTTTNGIVTVTAPASGIVQKVENISNNGGTMTMSYGGGTATLTVTESTDNITYTAVTVTGKTFTPTVGTYIKITLSSGTISLAKLEDGSVANNSWHPYDGEFGGESQARRRYLPMITGAIGVVGQGVFSTTARGRILIPFGVKPRVPPTGIVISSASAFNVSDLIVNTQIATALTFVDSGSEYALIDVDATSAVFTIGRPAFIRPSTTAAYLYLTGCEL